MIRRVKKKRLPEFVLAKPEEKNPRSDLRRAYRRNIEKGLILSLLLFILFFKLFPRLESRYIPISEGPGITIEIIDIPETSQKEPPPPPPEPVKIPEAPKPRMEAKSIKIIENEFEHELNIRERQDDEELALDLSEQKQKRNFFLDSPLGDFGTHRLVSSRVNLESKVQSLSLESSFERFDPVDESSLSITASEDNIWSDKPSEEVNLEPDLVKAPTETQPLAASTGGSNSEDAEESEMIISGNLPQFILKPAKSSIGMEEYKLWNKLNAELDRLNKDRYGELPAKNIIRHSDGLTLSFIYPNGIKHQISWQKGGKLWIKVIGKTSGDRVEELRRALNAIIKLTL